MKKKILFLATAGLVLGFLFLGVGIAQARDMDTLVVVLDHDVQTVNAAELKDGSNSGVFGQMHQGLMGLNPKTGEFENVLAESVKVVDGKDIWVKLRKGPKFHTGDPVTAHDVRFSWEQYLDKKNAYAGRFIIANVTDVEVLDDYTLIFRFKTPFAPWRTVVSMSILSKKYYEKVGWEHFRKNPVGSGPYRFVERKTAEYILMEAVENHIDYNVDFKKLKFVVVPDGITRTAMLQAGEVDLIARIMPHQVKSLKRNSSIKVKSSSFDPNNYALRINRVNFPVLKDNNLIEAINHAIDREAIIKTIYLGEGTPLYGSFAKGEIGYNTRIKYDYNPEKARELLKKSAYKGEELVLTYNSKVINGSQLSAVLQKYLKDVGINLKPKLMEVGALSALRRKKQPGMGHFNIHPWSYPDPFLKQMLNVFSKGPFSLYVDRPNQALVDKLVIGQLTTMDPAKRLEILYKLEDALKGTEISMFSLTGIYAMNNRIDWTKVPGVEFISHLWAVKKVK